MAAHDQSDRARATVDTLLSARLTRTALSVALAVLSRTLLVGLPAASIRVADLADATGLRPSNVRSALSHLVRLGLLERTAHGSGPASAPILSLSQSATLVGILPGENQCASPEMRISSDAHSQRCASLAMRIPSDADRNSSTIPAGYAAPRGDSVPGGNLRGVRSTSVRKETTPETHSEEYPRDTDGSASLAMRIPSDAHPEGEPFRLEPPDVAEAAENHAARTLVEACRKRLAEVRVGGVPLQVPRRGTATWKRWERECRTMLETHGRPLDRTLELLAWVTGPGNTEAECPFVVHTPAALRLKWDRINQAEATARKRGAANGGSRASMDAWAHRDRARGGAR